MKKILEASRAEALLVGQVMPAIGAGKITGVKKVSEGIRQITLEGGRVVNVPASRIKAIVDATLRTKYASTPSFRGGLTNEQAAKVQQQRNLAAAFMRHSRG